MEELLGQEVHVVVDRPLGSKSVNHGSFYPINYGYLPKVFVKGKTMKAFVVGEFEPLEEMNGYVVAIVRRNNASSCKLVVCKAKDKYSKEQIKALVEFRERFHDSDIVMA